VGIVLDSSESAYIFGTTGSDNFPTTPGCYDDSQNGSGDIFVCKINSEGSDLIYSTFIGGEEYDDTCNSGIVLDAQNNVYILGTTTSTDFPTTPGCYDDTYNGGDSDIILCKLNEYLSELQYSTFIGGSDYEWGWGSIYLDNDNNVCFVENTNSQDFPTTPGCYDDSHNGAIDVVVCKLDLSDENTVPSLSIISPANHTEVNNNVTIEGTASSDDGAIEQVEASIDSGEWQTVKGTESWEYEWNTNTVSNGEHTLRFRAYDGELYSEIVELILNVDNDQANAPPMVTIDYPEDGVEVEGTITISGTASDGDGDETIETIELSMNGGGWEEASGTTSWSYEWDTTLFEDGTITLEVRAFDGIDYSDIQEISLIVKNVQENIKPEVSILTPLPNTEVSTDVYCTGQAADEDGEIEKVEISIDTGAWLQIQGTGTWAFSWDSTTVENGIHTLRVRSYDGEEYSFTITVNNEEEKEGDNWYDEPFYIGGLVSVIIVVVIVVALLFMRKRNDEYYDDWGDEEYYEDSDEEW